jgi:prepilin-type N-terminal cleavage/methylation domain-containing protein
MAEGKMKRAIGNPAGFTLIEITAVILIMGILAAATILTLAQSARQARDEAVRKDLEQADFLVRTAARQSGQVQHLVFDLIHENVSWQSDGGEAKQVSLLQLSKSDMLTVRTEDGTSDFGKIQIDVSPSGYSSSYAVRIHHDDSGSPWMVVAGMTGQFVSIDNDNRMEEIFKSLNAGDAEASPTGNLSAGDVERPDAH